MDLKILLIIVLAIVLLILAFKIAKKILSLIFKIASLILMIYLVVIAVQYMDKRSLEQDFQNENNLFVLHDNNIIITVVDTKDSTIEYNQSILEQIRNKNDPIHDKYFKIVLVDYNKLDQEEKDKITLSANTDKTDIFKNIIQQTILSGNIADILIQKQKNHDIEVYENTIAFKKFTITG